MDLLFYIDSITGTKFSCNSLSMGRFLISIPNIKNGIVFRDASIC